MAFIVCIPYHNRHWTSPKVWHDTQSVIHIEVSMQIMLLLSILYILYLPLCGGLTPVCLNDSKLYCYFLISSRWWWCWRGPSYSHFSDGRLCSRGMWWTFELILLVPSVTIFTRSPLSCTLQKEVVKLVYSLTCFMLLKTVVQAFNHA